MSKALMLLFGVAWREEEEQGGGQMTWSVGRHDRDFGPDYGSPFQQSELNDVRNNGTASRKRRLFRLAVPLCSRHEETYSLQAGQIVVLDNLQAHKSARVKLAIEAKG
jgi:hypothetical protein